LCKNSAWQLYNMEVVMSADSGNLARKDQLCAIAQELFSLGLVRVTGLMVRDTDWTVNPDKWEDHPVHVDPKWFGYWAIRRGQLVVVTVDGDIWIGPKRIMESGIHLSVCPSGEGNFDFHSEDQGLYYIGYFARIERPDFTWEEILARANERAKNPQSLTA